MSAWAVLVVGGTPGEAFGHADRPWPDPGQQVSFLQTLGKVYRDLATTIGPERIVVIAGLNSALRWLDRASELGHPPCEPEQLEFCLAHTRVEDPQRRQEQKAKYRERADAVRVACRELLEHGGADYDDDRLRPDVVCSVLAGNPQRPGDRVVPKEGVGSLFVWFTSHGGHHAVAVGETEWQEGDPNYPRTPQGTRPLRIPTYDKPCDMCASPHDEEEQYDHEHSSLRTREWFMLMPHRSTDMGTYGPVTTAGRDMVLPHVTSSADVAKVSPLACLYWQQVVAAIAPGCIAGRKTVMLYQFCTSGGHCKWLSDSRYLAHLQVDSWPVFQMATSREQQYSLGATFTNIFMNNVSEALKARQGESIREVFRRSEKQYWDQHKVEARMNASAQSEHDRFGELVFAEGIKSSVGDTPAAAVFENTCTQAARI